VQPRRPTREEQLAATERVLPDVIVPGLRVLFCGINPGLYSAATGHHFARPGNRFWPALHRAGFTPRLLRPDEQDEMPALGLGLTNVVARASAAAAELSSAELVDGARVLREKVERFAPAFLAVLGVTVYRAAFARPGAALGMQDQAIGSTRVWVLPNPSGLNAHYRPDDLARLFRELRDAAFA
jgi:TDG/mug DNA glycosylase family protein